MDIMKLRENSAFSQRFFQANDSMPYDSYKYFDEMVVKTAKKQLNIVDDLNEFGLVDRNLDLGDQIVKYQTLSEMSEANVSMSGLDRGQRDSLAFNLSGAPVPMFSKEFQYSIREVQATLDKPGRQLPTLGLEEATYQVSKKINDMCWNGFGNAVDGNTLYGLTNHPNRNTKTISNSWGGGSETPVADVQDMIAKLQADDYGLTENSCILYVSSDNWSFIENDYSSAKGDRTYKERFKAFSPIADVKLGSGLGDGELVLVDMNRNVLELKVGQDLTWVEQPQYDFACYKWLVYGAMALVVKSDYNNKSGIVHATGA
jgi:hypothetical protein